MDIDHKPGEINFRIGSVPVTIQPYFWLITIILSGSWFNVEPRPWPIATWVFACLVSIVLHELGHVWMGQFFGARNCHIVLTGMGGLAYGAQLCTRIWQRIMVYLAGPGIQFLFAGLIYLVIRFAQLPEEESPLVPILLTQLLLINIIWPLFNLLPIFPLDGGQVANEIFHGISPNNGEKWSALLSLAACGGMIYWILQSQGAIYNAILFGLFAMTNLERLQRASGRRDDSSDWRN